MSKSPRSCEAGQVSCSVHRKLAHMCPCCACITALKVTARWPCRLTMASAPPTPPVDEELAEANFVRALRCTDKYMEQHGAAAALLRDGWFNIARARHATNVHWVGLAFR